MAVKQYCDNSINYYKKVVIIVISAKDLARVVNPQNAKMFTLSHISQGSQCQTDTVTFQGFSVKLGIIF